MKETIPHNTHRQYTRRYGAFPVFVRGILVNGQRIKITSLTDNVSQGGVFLQQPFALLYGAQLFTFVRLSGGAGLAAIGRVVRVEHQERGLVGVAIHFRHIRLLPVATSSRV